MDKPAKSLHRMLSAAGNPTLSHVSAMLAAIAAYLGVEIQTKVKVA
jgi:DNA-binding phage protein